MLTLSIEINLLKNSYNSKFVLIHYSEQCEIFDNNSYFFATVDLSPCT